MPDSPALPDPTGLVFRSVDDGPGLHALIVGVSDYPYLIGGSDECRDPRGLRQLDSAARTAHEVVSWLERAGTTLGHSLRTCRLLASPSEAELAAAPALADALPATADNLAVAARAWRVDAATDRDGAALFYFAGHGIQRTRSDSLLLLADFLAPGAALAHAVDVDHLYAGMGEPGFTDMAQTQYYFVDACRTDLAGVQELVSKSAPAIWDVTSTGQDKRVAPIFFAAGSGQAAFGSIIPGGVSAFGSDLLACLDGAAATKLRKPDGSAEWAVTIGSLATSLPQLMETPGGGRAQRSFTVVNWTGLDSTIVALLAAPVVECVVRLAPDDAASCASVDLALGAGGRSYSFAAPLQNPHPFKADAGGYVLRAAVPTGAYPEIQEVVMVLPPRFIYPIRFHP